MLYISRIIPCMLCIVCTIAALKSFSHVNKPTQENEPNVNNYARKGQPVQV